MLVRNSCVALTAITWLLLGTTIAWRLDKAGQPVWAYVVAVATGIVTTIILVLGSDE